MFGVTWRTAGTGLFAAFSTAIVLRVLAPLIDQMNHESHWLVTSFNVLTENILLIAVLSAMLMFLIASIGGGQGVGRGQMKRISYAHGVTVGMALAAVLYFRFGLVITGLATNEHAGMFSTPAALAEEIVPVVIGIILAATWLWVFISPWQEELRRRERQQQVRVQRGPR